MVGLEKLLTLSFGIFGEVINVDPDFFRKQCKYYPIIPQGASFLRNYHLTIE